MSLAEMEQGSRCIGSCKEGIPFAAGILWENDREYPVAEALASVVIREKPLNRSQMRPLKLR